MLDNTVDANLDTVDLGHSARQDGAGVESGSVNALHMQKEMADRWKIHSSALVYTHLPDVSTSMFLREATPVLRPGGRPTLPTSVSSGPHPEHGGKRR